MSNNVKVGLMGLLALGLIGFGYVLWDKSDKATQDNVQKIEAGQVDANADKAKLNTLSPNDPNAEAKKKELAQEKAKKEKNAPIVDPDMPKTKMTFEKKEHDYGKVEQKTENEYIFKFTNSGTNPLLISKAKGSCGCTVPNYPKEPIAPGDEGEIRVVYSSRTAKGNQTKTVTVWANTEPEQTQLRISADVQAPAE